MNESKFRINPKVETLAKIPVVICSSGVELPLSTVVKIMNNQEQMLADMDAVLVAKNNDMARLKKQIEDMQAELIGIYGLDQPFNDEDSESEDAEDMSWIN